MTALALALHTLAAVVWVGGMFFAHMLLRPAAMAMEPKDRLALWGRVFARFFPWVWGAILLLLATGYGVVFFAYSGFAGLGLHVHAMQATGLVMMALFVFLYFGPYARFRAALAQADIPAAARHQAAIRRIIGINLPLGLLTAAIGATGSFWNM